MGGLCVWGGGRVAVGVGGLLGYMRGSVDIDGRAGQQLWMDGDVVRGGS